MVSEARYGQFHVLSSFPEIVSMLLFGFNMPGDDLKCHHLNIMKTFPFILASTKPKYWACTCVAF